MKTPTFKRYLDQQEKSKNTKKTHSIFFGFIALKRDLSGCCLISRFWNIQKSKWLSTEHLMSKTPSARHLSMKFWTIFVFVVFVVFCLVYLWWIFSCYLTSENMIVDIQTCVVPAYKIEPKKIRKLWQGHASLANLGIN